MLVTETLLLSYITEIHIYINNRAHTIMFNYFLLLLRATNIVTRNHFPNRYRFVKLKVGLKSDNRYFSPSPTNNYKNSVIIITTLWGNGGL